ncbi:mobilization protein [Acinetobacter faecalis]|uniref:relaxase/mobilization nuclease domain-containing protein n=1 Tax=Acinetobacter faecalis TaxID=2665161 RepID=UPI002A90E29E|nr:relaxase/mobilization nuclease domain-containing protein [Acinetobacter faecalis]MDY6469360.1 mobilization protein [Acinetobacter faecalis]
MIVDFFRHGSGLSKGCLDYLLGEDREREREHAEILSGDVELTAQLIDSSPFAKKYTAGCLSFYEHDLEVQDKEQIMQNFEGCLFPGLERDQYQILWVQHQDKVNQETGQTRLELNFVIPNVELLTGKRLQPFYAPVDLERVDLFKQITNTEHSLYDPDAPEHKQLFLKQKNLPREVKDFKEQLNERVYRAVVQGDIGNRAELVEWLESNDLKVTRQTQKSISIENPYEDAKRPIRLNGEMYEQGFRVTREYRQEVQQRIKDYRGTTGERYKSNLENYQRQLEHKSHYHRERYPTDGRDDLTTNREQFSADREATRAISSLATVEIEPTQAHERADRDSRVSGTEQTTQPKIEPFEYGADFSSSYFNYIHYCARVYGKKQIQRDPDFEQRDCRETNNSRSPEQIRGQFEYQHVQDLDQQTTPVHTDQQECRELAGWIHDTNGILSDDRARNAIIRDYRNTTEAIARATTEFRGDAKQSYASIVGTVRDNWDTTKQLEADTTIIRGNAETISRSTEKYNAVHGAGQQQDRQDGTDDNLQREDITLSFTDAKRDCTNITAITEELARNFRDIEKNLIQINERQKEVEKPQVKQDRGMDSGM